MWATGTANKATFPIFDIMETMSEETQTQNQLDLLFQLSCRFRDALKECHKTGLPATFREFPKGSCGDACLLLAKWLEENGHTGFSYVCGLRNGQSHAWLERHGIIVDLTADQFPEISDTVIVTRNQSWHNTFEERESYSADFERYDVRTASVLESAYKKIKSAIGDFPSG